MNTKVKPVINLAMSHFISIGISGSLNDIQSRKRGLMVELNMLKFNSKNDTLYRES